MGYAIILGFAAIVLIFFSILSLYYIGLENYKAKEVESKREKVLLDSLYYQHNKINITKVKVYTNELCKNYTLEITAINRGSATIDKSKLQVFEKNQIMIHDLSSGWKPFESITFNVTGLYSYVNESRVIRLVTDYGGIAIRNYYCEGNCSDNTTFSNWNINSSYAGTIVNFSINITDLDYIESITFTFDNGTGEYKNDTPIIFPKRPEFYGTGIKNYSFSTVKRVNSTVGSLIRYGVYVNDSCGNAKFFGGNFLTTYFCNYHTLIGQYEYTGTNADTDVTLTAIHSDGDYITGVIFYLDNGTGTFYEYPYEPVNPPVNVYQHQKVIHTNPNVGSLIRYYVKVNDSCGNIATGSIESFTTT
ncbi:MAG: hypothetical protein QXJ06_04020 [Candidatus Aenigmatarchaeota archaeon]